MREILSFFALNCKYKRNIYKHRTLHISNEYNIKTLLLLLLCLKYVLSAGNNI
jgi:hypothetical protein